MTWRLINQLDGSPNAGDNCVAACIAMLVWNLAGVYVSPDSVKSAIYGASYLGFMNAAKFVGFCASHAVHLAPFNGAPASLIDEMRRAVDAGEAAVFTVPSEWPTNTDTGFTHVMIAYARSGDAWYIADPWGGKARTWATDYLQARLRRDQIWEATAVSDLASAGWHDTGNFDPSISGILTAPNGIPIISGFRAHVLTGPWSAENWPLRPEYPASPLEPGNPHWSGSRLDCRGYHGPTALGYVDHDITIASNGVDGPKAGVYEVWAGQDVIALEAQVATLTAHIAAAKQALGG